MNPHRPLWRERRSPPGSASLLSEVPGCRRLRSLPAVGRTPRRFTFFLVNPSGKVVAAGPAPQKVSRKSAVTPGSYIPAAGAWTVADRCPGSASRSARRNLRRPWTAASRIHAATDHRRMGGARTCPKRSLGLDAHTHRICNERPLGVAAGPEEGS